MRPGQAAPVFQAVPRRRHQFVRSRACFNEAGAGCPGIPRRPLVSRSGCRDSTASMRPGQAAPVFQLHPASAGTQGEYSCFNEAGAGCPGIPRERRRMGGEGQDRLLQ